MRPLRVYLCHINWRWGAAMRHNGSRVLNATAKYAPSAGSISLRHRFSCARANRLLFGVYLSLLAPVFAAEEARAPLILIKKAPLPNVKKPIDAIAVDSKGQRLFVSVPEA